MDRLSLTYTNSQVDSWIHKFKVQEIGQVYKYKCVNYQQINLKPVCLDEITKETVGEDTEEGEFVRW